MLQIRAADYDTENLSESENRIKVIVEKVRMPLTVLPVKNAVVKNFEMLESRVFSLLDSNERERGTSLVAKLPSRFKKVDVFRQNVDIGGRTVLGLSVRP